MHSIKLERKVFDLKQQTLSLSPDNSKTFQFKSRSSLSCRGVTEGFFNKVWSSFSSRNEKRVNFQVKIIMSVRSQHPFFYKKNKASDIYVPSLKLEYKL